MSQAKVLNQIATLLKVPVAKLTSSSDTIPACTIKGNTVNGLMNIVLSLVKEANSALGPNGVLEEAQVLQWLEYAAVYAAHINGNQNVGQILSELNGILRNKTFLVSHRLTIADIILYYFLYNIMENLGYLEKEYYVNVSRWFDNIQQDVTIRQKNKLIDFSTNYLVGLAPARH